MAAAESSILPDDVQVPALPIHRHIRENVARADQLPGIRVGYLNVLELAHDGWAGPGLALVSGTHHGDVVAADLARILEVVDQGKHVHEVAVGQHHDLVADSLVHLARIVDHPRLLPTHATISGPGEPGRPAVAHGALTGDNPGARIGEHQPVPDRVSVVGVGR